MPGDGWVCRSAGPLGCGPAAFRHAGCKADQALLEAGDFQAEAVCVRGTLYVVDVVRVATDPEYATLWGFLPMCKGHAVAYEAAVELQGNTASRRVFADRERDVDRAHREGQRRLEQKLEAVMTQAAVTASQEAERVKRVKVLEVKISSLTAANEDLSGQLVAQRGAAEAFQGSLSDSLADYNRRLAEAQAFAEVSQHSLGEGAAEVGHQIRALQASLEGVEIAVAQQAETPASLHELNALKASLLSLHDRDRAGLAAEESKSEESTLRSEMRTLQATVASETDATISAFAGSIHLGLAALNGRTDDLETRAHAAGRTGAPVSDLAGRLESLEIKVADFGEASGAAHGRVAAAAPQPRSLPAPLTSGGREVPTSWDLPTPSAGGMLDFPENPESIFAVPGCTDTGSVFGVVCDSETQYVVGIYESHLAPPDESFISLPARSGMSSYQRAVGTLYSDVYGCTFVPVPPPEVLDLRAGIPALISERAEQSEAIAAAVAASPQGSQLGLAAAQLAANDAGRLAPVPPTSDATAAPAAGLATLQPHSATETQRPAMRAGGPSTGVNSALPPLDELAVASGADGHAPPAEWPDARRGDTPFAASGRAGISLGAPGHAFTTAWHGRTPGRRHASRWTE